MEGKSKMQKGGQDIEKNDQVMDYNEFMMNNRIKVNRYLNTVLWFFVITGPAIAFGVKAGVFKDISYVTCANISSAKKLGRYNLMVAQNPVYIAVFRGTAE